MSTYLRKIPKIIQTNLDIMCDGLSGPLRGEGCSSKLIGLVEVISRSQADFKKSISEFRPDLLSACSGKGSRWYRVRKSLPW